MRREGAGERSARSWSSLSLRFPPDTDRKCRRASVLAGCRSRACPASSTALFIGSPSSGTRIRQVPTASWIPRELRGRDSSSPRQTTPGQQRPGRRAHRPTAETAPSPRTAGSIVAGGGLTPSRRRAVRDRLLPGRADRRAARRFRHRRMPRPGSPHGWGPPRVPGRAGPRYAPRRRRTGHPGRAARSALSRPQIRQLSRCRQVAGEADRLSPLRQKEEVQGARGASGSQAGPEGQGRWRRHRPPTVARLSRRDPPSANPTRGRGASLTRGPHGASRLLPIERQN